MKIPCVVIGGGLSGLAAAIRLARFIPDVVLLEQHTRLGGLNSYYYRNKRLFETGLHAITNYADQSDKKAPLNRLFRQLKLRRKNFPILQQKTSEIHFSGFESLIFSNDFELLETEIASKFPASIDGFRQLVKYLDEFDPFISAPFRSTREFIRNYIDDKLLIDMLLCPLMYYGSSVENDLDLSQFAIMFQAIYREGMFRPEKTIKEFLEKLKSHYTSLGGTIRLNSRVDQILFDQSSGHVNSIRLSDGQTLEPDFILTTIGYEETLKLMGQKPQNATGDRLGFLESIFQFSSDDIDNLPNDKTVIFFNTGTDFSYRKPDQLVDYNSGVICFPYNFKSLTPGRYIETRTTHLASYDRWLELKKDSSTYVEEKQRSRTRSLKTIEEIVGKLDANIVYEDTFTPLTIERYTSKKQGAIYGSPLKIKDGYIGFDNLFLAGTDQGFLGIIGAMLSGVSIVNQHILSRL